MYVFRECASSCNDTCLLVPPMADGLAEWRTPKTRSFLLASQMIF